MRQATRRRSLAVGTVLALAAGGAAAAPGVASAAPSWGCTSTALEGSLLGVDAPLGFLRANPPATPCAPDSAGLSGSLPLGVTVGAVESDTDLANATGTVAEQVATARSQIANLGLAPAGFANLLQLEGAESEATARCSVDGTTAQFEGSSQLTGLRFLGQTVDVSLPRVRIDAGLAVGEFYPNEQVLSADGRTLTQRALRVSISAALVGSVAEFVIAESSVSAVDAPCATSGGGGDGGGGDGGGGNGGDGGGTGGGDGGGTGGGTGGGGNGGGGTGGGGNGGGTGGGGTGGGGTGGGGTDGGTGGGGRGDSGGRAVTPTIDVSGNARRVRAGGTITYVLRVRNPSRRALRNVRVCHRLAPGIVFVGSKPKATVRRGRHCMTIKRLGARKAKTFRLTARALRGAAGKKVNVVTVTANGARTRRARTTVTVFGARSVGGGVTG
ncbi:DUF11 domain-containing protein [Conexibacter arvalis]|uniref:Putative repeat protein (TIGR01451 family) n=1 Tax=Conexibacter arvalis TaxID=912552 RepID=A0A840I8X5_9ACTN|nr:DUF11 domain-containing protein [Conexibacter arvalis]MBB4660558.1 putative repeat protein (TIGR01451 family) [Conexibacter arvalis]